MILELFNKIYLLLNNRELIEYNSTNKIFNRYDKEIYDKVCEEYNESLDKNYN